MGMCIGGFIVLASTVLKKLLSKEKRLDRIYLVALKSWPVRVADYSLDDCFEDGLEG